MKTALFLLMIVPMSIFAQDQVNWTDIPKKNGKYSSYITRKGNTISVGDVITIGTPSTPDGFLWISQGGQQTANFLAGVDVEITKIRTYKGRFAGKAYLEFKGYGLLPVSIDYEIALKTGEIEDPFLE